MLQMWTNWIYTSFSCELVFQYNLMQIVDCQTQIHGNTLDLIITNCNNAITSFWSLNIRSLPDFINHSTHSNHLPLNYILWLFKSRLWWLTTISFNCDLSNTNDVNEAWLIIKHVILSGMNQFFQKSDWDLSNIQFDLILI